MKQYTKEELKELVRNASKTVSEAYIPKQDEDDVEIIINSMLQIQTNCENIMVEVLDKILNHNVD